MLGSIFDSKSPSNTTGGSHSLVTFLLFLNLWPFNAGSPSPPIISELSMQGDCIREPRMVWNGSQTGLVERTINLSSLSPTLNCVVFSESGVWARGYVSHKRHGFALPTDQSSALKSGIQGSSDLAIVFWRSLPPQHYVHGGSQTLRCTLRCECPSVSYPALGTPFLLLYFLLFGKLFSEEMHIHPIFTQRQK